MSRYFLIAAVLAVWAAAFIPAQAKGAYPAFLNVALLPLGALAYTQDAAVVIGVSAVSLLCLVCYAFKIGLDFIAAVPVFFAFVLTPVALGVLRGLYKDMEALRGHDLAREETAAHRLADEETGLEEALRRLDEKVADIAELYEITKNLSAALSFLDAFRTLGEFLTRNFDFRECSLILVGEEKGAVEKVYRMESGGHPIAVEPDAEHRAVSNEILDAKRIMYKADSVAVPLASQDRITGVLHIRGLAQSELERFFIVSRQFSLAVKKIRMYERIQELAVTDGLTGIFVRRHFLQEFDEELHRSARHKFRLSFLMIDVDHFKDINDRYGHLVGDVVLKAAAGMMKQSIREVDLAARYGGEEFSVMLPETDKAGARLVAERLRRAVEAAVVRAYDETLRITISVGIATFPEDASNPADLIEQADKALYRAKAEGRNRVMFNQGE